MGSFSFRKLILKRIFSTTLGNLWFPAESYSVLAVSIPRAGGIENGAEETVAGDNANAASRCNTRNSTNIR